MRSEPKMSLLKISPLALLLSAIACGEAEPQPIPDSGVVVADSGPMDTGNRQVRDAPCFTLGSKEG